MFERKRMWPSFLRDSAEPGSTIHFLTGDGIQSESRGGRTDVQMEPLKAHPKSTLPQTLPRMHKELSFLLKEENRSQIIPFQGCYIFAGLLFEDVLLSLSFQTLGSSTSLKKDCCGLHLCAQRLLFPFLLTLTSAKPPSLPSSQQAANPEALGSGSYLATVTIILTEWGSSGKWLPLPECKWAKEGLTMALFYQRRFIHKNTYCFQVQPSISKID